MHNIMFNKKNKHSAPLECGYSILMKNADAMIEGKSKEDQIFILTYIINVVIDDLCHSTASNVLQKENAGSVMHFMPTSYYNQQGESICIASGGKLDVNLSDANVYSYPYDKAKIVRSLFDLRDKPFVYDKNNHFADYYTDIDICHTHNGVHHIHMGKYYKKGIIKADVQRTELLYPHYTTDGQYWYETQTGNKTKVEDFRIAVLFSLAQMRYNIKLCPNK